MGYNLCCYWVVCLFETGSHCVSLAKLELTMQSRLTLIVLELDMHHIQFYEMLGLQAFTTMPVRKMNFWSCHSLP